MTRFQMVFISGLILLISGLAQGQVNTEKLRQGLDNDGIAAGIELTYSITKGNSDLVEVGAGPGLVWRKGRHRGFMINELETATADGGDLINKGFSHLRYNYDVNRIWVYELFFQAQYDKTQDLTARYLAGSGMRIRLIQRQSAQLALGATAMYEYEELESGEITKIIRGSHYLSFSAEKKDRIAVSSTIYVQPKCADFNDIRVLGEATMGIMISKHFSFNNTLTYRYDAEPPAGIKEYDLKLKGGLKIGF